VRAGSVNAERSRKAGNTMVKFKRTGDASLTWTFYCTRGNILSNNCELECQLHEPRRAALGGTGEGARPHMR
jgi:hypothetical protein